ncbi:MAG TPA: alpha/beta fold hydrolase [Chthoniobacterales bacterium]
MNWKPAQVLLIVCILAVSAGCVSQPASGPLAEAEVSLKEARQARSNPQIAAADYLYAADAALHSSGSRSAAQGPDQARLTYNTACQELALLLQSNRDLWDRTSTVHSAHHIYRLHFASGSRQTDTWDPAYLDFLRTPKRLRPTSSSEALQRSGWGGVLLGVHKPAEPRKYFLPLAGLAVPVTAVVDFGRTTSQQASVQDATLSLYRPSGRDKVELAHAERPLAADLAAPTGYYPNPLLAGLYAMMRPGSYTERAGLYMLEPYDPDQIPVVFVHGLLSIPQMWRPTIDAIQSDPELRGKFQFWVFSYPTGDPIVLSALRLRESLAQVYQLYPRTKGMILIGHSMGGLLARLQSTDSKRVLWDGVFRDDADQLYATLPPDSVVKKALIFDANPRVRRIVFICVPHRGSYLATSWVGSLGVSLIRLPSAIISQAESILLNPLLKNIGYKRLPTGINGLSPRSPLLRPLDTLPINAPYHSIIGDRGRGDTPNSSDGVVPYWSSHLAGAQSELIVPGPHGSSALPQTIAELKRILRLDLETSSQVSLNRTKVP